MKSILENRISEIGLVVLVAAVILMMILPLPSVVLDLLIALNFAISVLIFCMALFVRCPLRFSVFPTLLLLATLYRLSLNVSTTRLILTRGEAGQIIGGFSGFVVGDDIIVGAVLFGILLVVLFLVVTRGAERVAEVSARFTLDAMPGMQAGIEADLRSKAMSPREIGRKRAELEHRSMYYGSLDGAMKFVRGDALAALLITAINILGGTTVGMIRMKMSLGNALNHFGRLTIGDGLVTMIPALLISTAAGVLVTRLAHGEEGDERLGSRIHGQLASERGPIVASGALMLLLGLIPGLPVWPFVSIGLALGVLALFQYRRFRAVRVRPGQRISGAFEVSLDEMQEKLDRVAAQYPVLVREAVYGRISLAQLSDIVTEMRQEGIDDAYLPDLLEALAREPLTEDADELSHRLRRRIRDIISRLVAPFDEVRAVVLDPDSEDVLWGSLERTPEGKTLVLSPDLARDTVAALARIRRAEDAAVLLTRPELRRPIRRFLATEMPDFRVIAHGELREDVRITLLPPVDITGMSEG